MKRHRPNLKRAIAKIAAPRKQAAKLFAGLTMDHVHKIGAILYVIVLDQEGAGEFSLFQGFSANAMPEFGVIRQICQLPAHMEELFRDRSQTARIRMLGGSGYSIVLVELEFLRQLREHPGFVCLVSNAASRASVAEFISNHKRSRWLHITTDETATDQTFLWDVTRMSIYEWIKSIALGLLTPEERAAREGYYRPLVEWEPLSVPVPSRGHNVLSPTETVFLSLGYSFDLPEQTMNGNQDNEFASALVIAANTLEQSLTDLTGGLDRPPGVPAAIITVPSVFRHLKPNQLRKQATGDVRRATRAVLRQSQYIAYRATVDEMEELYGSAVARAIFGMRAQELFLYTAVLAVSACSLCAPIFRLPPQLDRVRSLLVGLATLSRKGNEAQRRRNQIAQRIGDALRASIPEQLLAKLDTYAGQSVKLIGDVPLELLPIDGLPLSLRCSVSRLPTLPGNLMVRHGLMRLPSFFQPSDFYDVLVVRSFRANDPIRRLLEVSIPVVLRRDSKVKVRFVDVSTEQEFIDAFNNFDGKIAIFDGHCAQASDDPQGALRVGDVEINPFQFYGKIRIPPIVLLSACETHTMEGFESSVASAFLFMGAWSVLGTLAPVDARSAASLIARFLFRLDAFLPILKVPMNWTEVVTGMLRMTYVTDIMFKFEQLLGLAPGRLRSVQMTANIAINSGEPDWFEKVISKLAEETGESEEQTRERWRDTCYFSETLRHVHLGTPEHIFVVPV